MPPPRRSDDPAALRRFFLARTPDEGEVELAPEDHEHAARVLRLGVGDRLIGLDGRGSSWPLFVRDVRRDGLVLGAAGEPVREPAPGTPDAPLPRIELVLPAPRGAHAEELVDRATQLGVAAIRFSITVRTKPEARELGGNRERRLARIATEACKQCGRLWLPELAPPRPLAELLASGGATAVRIALEPDPQAVWLGELVASAPGARAFTLFAGPEGGFAPEELEALAAAGARRARLAPFVLRVETAAEAALAVLVEVLGSGRRAQ